MRTIETSSLRERPPEQRRGASVLHQGLLLCGVVTLPVYVAADVLGGMRYRGYSYFAQAISELMAVGAPSERWVDPLFIAFDVLLLAFGVGVLRDGARAASRALRITGAVLTAYAVVGLTGPTLFEMHPRGTAQASDLPHIVTTAAIVLLTMLAIGVGAFALGRRFRRYSLATLVTIVVLGVASVPYGARIAAGLPTPGFGIVERILVYSSLLWIAVLGVALLRRYSSERSAGARVTAHVEGALTLGWRR